MMARYGMLPHFNLGSDGEEGDEQREVLLRCCQVDRPRKKKASLLVKASGEFLTIHDYVSAVHPWLLGLRGKILQAAGDLLDHIPLPADTRLMVVFSAASPETVDIYTKEDWLRFQSLK